MGTFVSPLLLVSLRSKYLGERGDPSVWRSAYRADLNHVWSAYEILRFLESKKRLVRYLST